MSHYARINSNSLVVDVIVIDNSQEPTEAAGIAFCEQITGQTGWIKTSYNATIRKNYAGIGYTWDAGRNAFIPPKPFPSWVLNETTCKYSAPVSYPTDGNFYQWNETTQQWDQIT
jgi:hypothetical protein